MKKIVKTLFIALLFASLTVLAETEEDGNFWLNVNAQGKLPIEHLNWYAEIQPRWREEGKHFDTLILRPAIFYKFSDQGSIWVGYASVRNHPSGRSTQEENRFWQQFMYDFEPIETLKFQNRTRLEQRRLETGSDTGYRLRQMLRVTKPIKSQPDIKLVVWDELFVHLNDTDWGAHQGFDQNRLFLGAAIAIQQGFIVEAGYMNQYINSSEVNRINHVLSTTINLNF